MHARVVKTGFVLDVVVASSVVGMYAKCRVFGRAVQMFDEMRERDVACWNTVISCYYQDGQCKKALQVFEEMRRFGFNPDSVTLTTIISSCARLLDLERGRQIHRELMMTGFLHDGYISSALVDMYGKCGCLHTAREVFEKIPRKSVVAWNSMIAGYGLRGQSDLCLELFRRMNKEGTRPTSTTLSSLLTACSRSAELQNGKFVHGYIIRNRIEADIYINGSLIDLYFKCGNSRSAEMIFKNLSEINVIYWNLMISGYVILGRYLEALRLFDEMREAGVRPDAITFSGVLPACSQSGALEKGREIHKCIIQSKLETNEVVMGAVLDMYAKCGAVDEAVHVFDRLPERDFVSWTSMIMAYGSHGQALDALKLFHHMQHSDAKPDRITFLALMSACSHGGLVKEGQYYFDLMVTQYDIKPSIEHYSCLVDLLGRAGRLHEAYNIIRNTPDIQDDIGLLSTLFSACHLHREMELGVEIAGLLVEKDPDDPSTYIVLSNMYASAKKWDDVRRVRLKIKELRLNKNPGCSWIEVDKTIRPFFAEDIPHPQAGVYLECLAILNRHMEKDESVMLKDISKGMYNII